MQFTVPLALFDFLPVLVTGIGFGFLIRLVARILPAQGRIAYLGGVLIISGGFFRALWKLLLALSSGGIDINWMEDGLFIFMAPGYILFAWSIWQVSRSAQGKRLSHAWVVPTILIVCLLVVSYYLSLSAPGSPAWKRILLSATVLANVLSGILLIAFAFREKLAKAGWLFLVNLGGILVLNGLARLPEQSVSIHWMDEGLNLAAWMAFALAARIVYTSARERFGVDAANLPPLAAK